MQFRQFLIAAVASLVVAANVAVADVPKAELSALEDLYHSTGGASWGYRQDWLYGDPCTHRWHGVMCDESNSSVTGLHLGNNQMSGSIPDSLGNLFQLINLDLDHNQLSGSIPGSLGNLSQLLRLDLSYNQLSGSIPDSLGSLSQLDFLGLNSNSLTSVPDSLALLVLNIGKLDISRNNICSIPSGLKKACSSTKDHVCVIQPQSCNHDNDTAE